VVAITLVPEEYLNKLVNAGQFNEAVKYVRNLELPNSAQQDIFRQLAEMAKEYESNMARAGEWNEKLNSLLKQGNIQGAISFVESSDLPWDKKKEVVNNIHDAERQQEERKCQAEQWMRELSYLIGKGKIRKAKKYVNSLPIDESAKNTILSRI